MVSRTFLTGICKNAKYSVQKIEKWQANGRTNSGAIDLGEAVLTKKRETEWTLKLRTVYPYGLNEKVDIYDDDNNVKKFKSDDGIAGKLFPSLPRLFQMDQTCRNLNRKGINILNYKQFITSINNYLKDDLPNALNYIRVSLASTKKRHLKQIADYINDFLNDQNSEFFLKPVVFNGSGYHRN